MTAPYVSPGLKARAAGLKDLLRQMQDLKELQRTTRPGEPFTGTMDTRYRLQQAREALRRQIRVSAGLPALDSNK